MKHLFLVILFVFSFINANYSQRVSRFIAPQTTDSAITTNLNNHYVSINSGVSPKNQLFVFLPGTGAVAFNYLEINKTAADLGFHSINLTYPNDQAVNTLCNQNGNTNLNCFSDIRLETIDGTDRTTLVNINRSNSIENRIIKLIIYLRTQFPNENWGQFLINDSTINWSKIVIAGHSQGGGHAGIIGRYHSVVRVLMFASMDFNGLSNSVANWINQPNSTPNASTPDKFWAFSHQTDDLVNFQILSTRIWTAFGMPQSGAIVNVDNVSTPYNNTHQLTSTLNCVETHGCIVADARLVLLPDGTPVYKSVWQYLLSNTTSPLNLSTVQFLRIENVINRPILGITTKYYKLKLSGNNFDATSKVFVNNQEVETEFISPTELKSKLPAGKIKRAGSLMIKILYLLALNFCQIVRIEKIIIG
ncbi:MAG: hypothetical protein MUC29_12090 [Pyrinomonadaceae bacterium]|nr:hypothetical protein [Pyrinomonadaceae bacterium]